MTAPTYQAERWFSMLREAVGRSSQSAVARKLGISPSMVNQVLHAGGNYGKGTASTAGIERRVLDTYGNWPCPYLGDDQQPRVITAEQCRAYAHREAPTGSPRDLAHWRACRTCEMKEHSSPPVQRVPVPRTRQAATEANPSTPPTAGDPE